MKIPGVSHADLQLATPQAVIRMERHIPIQELQAALHKAGKYEITETAAAGRSTVPEEKKAWIKTYKPVLIIFCYIIGITLISEAAQAGFVWERWMQNFMAGFFLAFSFFKLLDIKGFAESYFSYDIIAKKWMAWGYIYPFVELALGVAYLAGFQLLFTNIVTFAIMSISLAGVLASVLQHKQIKCACLGTVFNIPMSTVTVIEDGLMIAMSAVMLGKLL